MPAITVCGLRKEYRQVTSKGIIRRLFRPEHTVVPAVGGVSFTIEPGELVALIGPNGAGKSTIIKTLCGILPPTAGSVEVLNLTPQRDRRQLSYKIGTVFGQRTQLYPNLPAIDSLNYAAELYGMRGEVKEIRVQEVIGQFQLESFVNKVARTLSMGQRIRCDMAFALMHRPSVIFLDEPTIGLDIDAKQAFRELIRKVNQEDGVTVLVTSHDTGDIALTKRTIVIKDGLIIWDNNTQNLRRDYLHRKIVRVERAATLPPVLGIPPSFDADGPAMYVVDTTAHSIEQFLSAMYASRIRLRTVEDVSWEDAISAIYRGGTL